MYPRDIISDIKLNAKRAAEKMRDPFSVEGFKKFFSVLIGAPTDAWIQQDFRHFLKGISRIEEPDADDFRKILQNYLREMECYHLKHELNTLEKKHSPH